MRGACRALGVAGAVTSPTFTIAYRYDGDVAFLDLYRLGDLADEDPALLADEHARTASLWVSVRPRAWTPNPARVRLEHRGGDRRLAECARHATPPAPPAAS